MAKILNVADYRTLAETFEFKPNTFYMRYTAQDTKNAFLREVKQLEACLATENPTNRTKTNIRNSRKWLNGLLEIQPVERKRKERVEEDLSSYTHTLCFLGRRYGENATTKLSPIKPWSDEFLPMLEESVMCCRNSDDDGLIECNLYSKLSFTVPTWMTHETFDEIAWNYFLAAGGTVKWSKAHYDRIHRNNFEAQYAICKLINSTPRTDKRKALKANFLAWLDGADCLGRYDLSNICDEFTMREAGNASTRQYWDR